MAAFAVGCGLVVHAVSNARLRAAAASAPAAAAWSAFVASCGNAATWAAAEVCRGVQNVRFSRK